MKFMLMMNAPRGTGDWGVAKWAPADFKAHVAHMQKLNQDLVASGELAAAEALASPGQARIVRADKSGAPVVTDGPFAETKEFLAGFWIVDCENKERAHAIAARVSLAPGPGGAPLRIPVEVREVLSASPKDM
jgi:hypothetical protein